MCPFLGAQHQRQAVNLGLEDLWLSGDLPSARLLGGDAAEQSGSGPRPN